MRNDHRHIPYANTSTATTMATMMMCMEMLEPGHLSLTRATNVRTLAQGGTGHIR